jgi:glutamate---cysteine ligase / carboxylate-amine ligase
MVRVVDGLTLGVEEEFLLVDAVSRRPAPLAGKVLPTVRAGARDGTEFHAELLTTQVEAASPVCTGPAELRERLVGARRRLAAAARAEGLRLVSTGTPVLAGPPPPFTAGERFERISRIYAAVVEGYQACGCHVHVGVAGRDTAVAVLNHLRPWLPTLLALSVNSPYDRGRDSGYGSWRMLEQARFPGSGVPPWFASAAEYDSRLASLVECGALVDEGQSFWLARPSPSWPTVEFRVADAAATADEAVLQAVLSRALVRTGLAELAAGREAPRTDDSVLAAAVWSAARHGLDGPGVHPSEERSVPAARLVEELLGYVRPVLEELGDTGTVTAALARLTRSGTGAQRQRRAAVPGLAAVVDMLAEQVVAA